MRVRQAFVPPPSGILNLQSTVGIDAHNWNYQPDQYMLNDLGLGHASRTIAPVGIDFHILDFAGQVEYLTTHKVRTDTRRGTRIHTHPHTNK